MYSMKPSSSNKMLSVVQVVLLESLGIWTKMSTHNISFMFVFWCCCWSFQISATNSLTIRDRYDKSAVIVPRQAIKTDDNANSLPDDSRVPMPNNTTLLITAPIAAGIFLMVILFFCFIFYESKQQQSESTDRYQRLNEENNIEDQVPGGSEQQPSTSAAAAANNFTSDEPVINSSTIELPNNEINNPDSHIITTTTIEINSPSTAASLEQ